MGCVQAKLEDAVTKAPIFPKDRHKTNFYWLLLFCFCLVFTFYLVGLCYNESNWGNLEQIADYPGNGMILLMKEASYAWEELTMCFGITIGLSLILTVLMQWISSILMVTSLGLISVFLIVISGFLWDKYEEQGSAQILTMAILVTVIMIVWFLFFIQIGRKIEIIFHLYNLAGHILHEKPMILLIGCLVFLVNLLGILFFVYSFCVVTAAWLEIRKIGQEEDLFNLIKWGYIMVLVSGCWWVYLFQSCQHFLVGYTVGAWYFKEENMGPNHSANNGVLILLKYHLGTMCFGSFIMSALWVVKELILYLRRFRKSYPVVRYIGVVAGWFLFCLGALWEIVSANAYYVTALYGFAFCTATRRGIQLTTMAERMLIGLVGNTVTYMCVIMVAFCSSTLVAALLETGTSEYQYHLGACMFLFSLIISYLMLSVFLSTTRALYLCICVDIEKNGIALPFTMSPLINSYVVEVQKFSPPPPPPLTPPPKPGPRVRRADEEDEDEEEFEEEEE